MPVETAEMLTPALPRGVTVEQASQWPDTAEAARRLNVSKRTVLRRYRAYRIAGQRRYDPRDLAADVVQLPAAGGAATGVQPRTPTGARAVLDRAFGSKRAAQRVAERGAS